MSDIFANAPQYVLDAWELVRRLRPDLPVPAVGHIPWGTRRVYTLTWSVGDCRRWILLVRWSHSRLRLDWRTEYSECFLEKGQPLPAEFVAALAAVAPTGGSDER